MTLTLQEWKSLIQNKINTYLSGYGSVNLYDFVVGSVADTVTMVMAYLTKETWSFFYFIIDQAFVCTAVDVYLQRHASTFDVPVSSGTEATGIITFTRSGTTGSLTIPAGTRVGTSSETIIGVSFATDADATITPGNSTVTAAITAEETGTAYNVEAGTIRYLLSPVVGITTVSNGSATSGGTNADTNHTLRTKILNYIANIGRATKEAIDYRSESVTGVEDVSVIENPEGVWETYNTDQDVFVYTGTWTSVDDNDYYWGDYIHTTTDTDYVEFYSKGNNTVVPVIGHTATSTVFEVFLDGVSKYTMDSIGTGTTFDALRINLPDRGTHIIKIVKNSGSDLILDSVKVFSNEKRIATIDVYVNDGSGSASWDLLKLVKTEVDAYRAAGIQAFIKRSEIKTIDFSIGISWNKNADKTTTKDNIEADISEYLTRIKSGGVVYVTNIYQFVTSQSIGGVGQVNFCNISIPSQNIQLEENEIARIGTVTFYEL